MKKLFVLLALLSATIFAHAMTSEEMSEMSMNYQMGTYMDHMSQMGRHGADY